MSEPNAHRASNAAKSCRFPVSQKVALPGALVVLVGVFFAVASQLGVFEPRLTAEERADGDEGKLEGKALAAVVEPDDANPADRRGGPGSGAPAAAAGRSAPKALDISDKDLVKNAGLLAVLGSRDGHASGDSYGPSVGDSAGLGGLGLRGTGSSGGGAMGGTIGLGGLGTKGRGGGLAAFGHGAGAGLAPMEVRPGMPLKAGATDDNAEFDKYVQFLSGWSDRGDTGVADLVDVRDRRFVRVVDAKGLPVPTASVRIVGRDDQVATSGTTYGDGRLPFFPRALRRAGAPVAYSVEASFGGQKAAASWDGTRDLTLAFDADRAIDGAVQLDVLFALDTTGSMSDEIDRIKATLLAVTDRLRGLPQKFDLRYGAVLFRDLGDDYVTRPIAFTSDVHAFMQALRVVDAGGGGDEPESVNRALAEAVAAKWRAGAAKVVFLVGDAPPHMDYPGEAKYGETMKAALAKGIRVHSIAASGLTALGTLVWRQVAQYTRGKFVFIEYGSAQATAAAHGVKGNFRSNNLDDILFEQIRDELDGWGRAEAAPQNARQEPAPEAYAGPIRLHPRGR